MNFTTGIFAPLVFVFIFTISAFSRELPSNGKILKVKKGETLIQILRKHGWKQSDLSHVLQHKRLRKRPIFPKEIYYLAKNPATIVLFEKQSDNAFFITKKEAKKDKIDFDIKRFQASGKVKGSLQSSLLKAVNSLDIAQKFMNAYLLEFNLRRDIYRNAPFTFEYEKKYIGDTFIKYGEVLSTSLELRSGRTVKKDFVFFKNGGGAFITKSKSNSKKLFYAPVKYLHITSLYQPRRRHPITKRIIPHMGVDFELPTGSAVLASAYGTVVKKGKNRAAGRYLVVDHHNGYKTYYNHMSSVAELRIGEKVQAGEVLGKIGCSGYCTKPHLHFSIKKNGRYVNPAKLIYTYPYTQNRKVQAYLNN